MMKPFFTDARLETFPLNIWYILLAVVVAIVVLFLFNYALTEEMIACGNCQRAEKETVPCYLCDKKVSKVKEQD
jgi:hypothetical protein